MRVFDAVGREVAVLFNREAEAGRTYRVSLSGNNLPSGVCFYRLESAGRAEIRRMMLIK